MGRSKGVELSPRHGVNPTLLTCFWCGRQTGGIALLGRIRSKKWARDDIEAPRETCMGLEPCPECRKKFEKGVLLIEVCDDGSRFKGNEAFAIRDTDGVNHWPTGRFAVLREGAIRGRKAGQRALCDRETMDAVLGASKGREEANG